MPPSSGSDPRTLSDLLEVSQTLGSTLNLRAALLLVVAILEESHGRPSSAITSKDERGGGLAVEAASGASKLRGDARYRLGEGITGRVVQSGRPIVVPRVSREPLFLDKSGVFKKSGKDELSFVCVPIKADKDTVGALGVALPYHKDRSHEQEA